MNRAAFRFFHSRSGAVGRAAIAAAALARAEDEAVCRGWRYDWAQDVLCDCAQDHGSPNIFCCDGSDCRRCILYTADGYVLTALGCICEPDANYCRLIEAELAAEAVAIEQEAERACAL